MDRNALVKIFGGQGTPTENIVPPTIGPAYRTHHFYPYDLAKAKALVQASGDAGMAVTVESHSVDPVPKAAQYLASVLDRSASTPPSRRSTSRSTGTRSSTQTGDPQVAFVQFDQDYPEAQDFIDVQLNGEHIANVGNQVHSNVDIQPSTAASTPRGPCRRGRAATPPGRSWMLISCARTHRGCRS